MKSVDILLFFCDCNKEIQEELRILCLVRPPLSFLQPKLEIKVRLTQLVLQLPPYLQEFNYCSTVQTIQGGYLFTTHWVVWGKVANTGGTASTPISVQIACANTNSGAPLYSTTTPLVPSVLGPGETGTFSQPISSDDLQGTKYSFSCTAQPVVQ